jgi:WD40 repeat protein
MTDATHALDPPAVAQGSALDYDAFLSYTHVDEQVAKGIQKGLHHIGKRLGQLRALRVFRDVTDLAANDDLWGNITATMARARYLIVVLSPHAAAAPWVDRELRHWLEVRGREKLLLVLADGQLEWDEHTGRFDPQLSTAAPPVLTEPGSQPTDPLYIDVHADAPWDYRAPVFRQKVTKLAAPIHGKSIDQLFSDDLRERRRFRRWRRAAIAGLVVLTVAAIIAAFIAVKNERVAERQTRIALSRQLASTATSALSTNPRAAFFLAATGYHINKNPQTLLALTQADTANPNLVRYFGVDRPITKLVGSGDGKTIVAGLDDGRVVRWNTTDNAPTSVITLSQPIASLAVSGDASVIVASDNSTAALWRSGQIAVLPVPAGQSATAVTVSPSGRTAVVHGKVPKFEGEECNVVFDVPTARQLSVHNHAQADLPTTTDLVASSDDDLLLFDGAYGGFEHRRIADWVLTNKSSVLIGVHQRAGPPSANGTFITATNGSPTIPVYSTRGPQPPDSDNPALTAQAPINAPGVLALSPDGTHVAIANAGSIYVAHVAPADAVYPIAPIVGGENPSGGPVREQPVSLSGAGTISLDAGLLRFLGDNTHLISATGNHVALWDLNQTDRLARTSALRIETPCNGCPGTNISISPDGKHAVLIASDQTAIQPTPREGEPTPGESDTPHLLPITGIPLWRHDGRLIMVTSQQQLGDPQAASKAIQRQGLSDAVQTLVVPASTSPPTVDAAFTGEEHPLAAALTADEKTVVIVNGRGDILVHDADTPHVETVPAPPDLLKDTVRDAAISSSAELIAMVRFTQPYDPGGTVRIYDLHDHRSTGSIPGNDVTYVRFARAQLLVQRTNGNLEVWDERGTAKVRTIGGDPAYTYAPVSDSQGKLLARMTGTGAIDLFDFDSGAFINEIPPLAGSVKTGYSFSPTGQVLAAAANNDNDNATLVLRDFSPKALLTKACEAAGSALSEEEWQTLAGSKPRDVYPCPGR